MRIRVLLLAAAALTLICGAAAAWSRFHRPTENSVDEQPNSTDAASQRVTLSPDKLASLEIQVEPAAQRAMQEVHVVPGRIQYDETRRVDIRAASNGILLQVRVALGDHVSAGQVLAIVSSPELGLARTEVHHSREDWELASKKLAWQREVSQNSFELIDLLKKRAPINDIETRFKQKTLGKSREVLISAYSRFLLAQTLGERAQAAGASVLPSTTVAERISERRSAEAALLAACEQAGFDVVQQYTKAEIEAGDALRRLNIAREQLTTLLGYAHDTVPETTTAGEVLSRVEIRAPFAGTIEEKRLAQSERVRTSDTIFVLADTTRLWVSADIREQDWRALAIKPGQELAVQSPALPGRPLSACVRHIGRQVDRQTNSVPLVAEISNADGMLRPGLFMQVSIPVGASKNVVCVPATAVVQHEGAVFVFVPDGPQSFRRTDVKTGMQADGRIELLGGIKEGTSVVVRGATALKSELLIETISKED